MPDPSHLSQVPKPHDLDLSGAIWYAAPEAPEGPQVAFVGEYIVMRHGSDPSAPPLVFDQDEWAAFKSGAAKGEFDNLT
ncbi:DUF397 domain-containing protein [Kitasatospora sp. NPDC057223]|uniref:DUF397 domain-containing protein n=1 Tax=Kitasatospora sp. NPDC057223 TaxID=3346055 RepID=UPI00363A8BE0